MLTWQALQDLDQVSHTLLGAGGQGDDLWSGPPALCILRLFLNN